MKRLLLLNFLYLIIFNSYSQVPEIQFERISVQQDLTDHSINCISQDQYGVSLQHNLD